MKAVLLSCCFAVSVFAQTKPLFQEDFESGMIDSKVWEKRVTGAATVELQQQEVAHGKYALQIHYPDMATQSFGMLLMPRLPEAAKGHFFGRAYVKIAPGLPVSHTVMVLAGASGWPLSKFEEIGVYQNKTQPSYQENKSQRGQGRGEDVRHGEELPMGKWFLLEWEFNDNPTTLTMWVERQPSPFTEGGAKVDRASFKWPKGSDASANLVGGFEEFGVGARVWGATPQGFDIYYDDIAIDTRRIGAVK